MTATFQLWISASSICLSLLHLIFNIINLAVRVNWYQLLAKHGINSEYHPQRFHAIIQRCKCRESSITASIFKSGRGIDWWNFGCWMSKSCFTCMSSHQPCSLQGFIENTTQTLRSLSLQIQNVVCAFKCPHQVAIEKMYEDYCRGPHQFNLSGKKAKMVYRPTSFAALRIMFRNGNQNIALMIFINGHVTLSGLKNIDDSRIFAQEFYSRILSNYIRSSCCHN